MSFFNLLLGVAVGVVYVELLFRVLKKGTSWALITYPIRASLFAILMAVFLLKSELISAIVLIFGFFIGLLIQTIIRGFIKVEVSKLS